MPTPSKMAVSPVPSLGQDVSHLPPRSEWLTGKISVEDALDILLGIPEEWYAIKSHEMARVLARHPSFEEAPPLAKALVYHFWAGGQTIKRYGDHGTALAEQALEQIKLCETTRLTEKELRRTMEDTARRIKVRYAMCKHSLLIHGQGEAEPDLREHLNLLYFYDMVREAQEYDEEEE